MLERDSGTRRTGPVERLKGALATGRVAQSGLGMWLPPPGPAAVAVGCSFFAAIPGGAEAALPHSLKLSVISPLPRPHPSSAPATARPHAQCSATPLPDTHAGTKPGSGHEGHSNVGRQQRSDKDIEEQPRWTLCANTLEANKAGVAPQTYLALLATGDPS
ncbi:unnamed protein product [Coccothraustes coccothraustes]